MAQFFVHCFQASSISTGSIGASWVALELRTGTFCGPSGGQNGLSALRQFYLSAFLLLLLAGCGRDSRVDSADKHDAEATSAGQGDAFQDKVLTYDSESRDLWQKPDRVLDLLGPLEEKTVLDIGAGSGYFAFRLVPTAGRVIAVDIDEDFVDLMRSRKQLLPSEYREKLDIRLAAPDDPAVVVGEVDAVLVVNTYAYIRDRVAYFGSLREKLRPRAKMAIIEFKMNNIPNGPPEDEKVAMSVVEEELVSAGYRNVKVDDQTLEYQYIVTATN